MEKTTAGSAVSLLNDEAVHFEASEEFGDEFRRLAWPEAMQKNFLSWQAIDPARKKFAVCVKKFADHTRITKIKKFSNV